MRWATCELNAIYVGGSRGGGRLAHGARVDLDAEISPGVTYEQALGDFVTHFRLDPSPESPLTGLPTEDEPTDEASRPRRR